LSFIFSEEERRPVG